MVRGPDLTAVNSMSLRTEDKLKHLEARKNDLEQRMKVAKFGYSSATH